MSSHPYNLRSSRVNSPANPRTSNTTPSSKVLLNPPHKLVSSPLTLQLEHVIGTTSKNPSGLSSCPQSNTFAYCAGSVAVLCQVDASNSVSHRYYRARPAASSLNQSTSYYSTPASTPTRKRNALVTPRKEQERNTPSRVLPEDENAKTWTARERIKSIKCVSLSQNGKFFAIGETGYNPRVLLFSTSKDANTETPLSIVNEHTWGVKSVAFSPDSCFLATLGEANDGYLFIWNVNPKSGSLRLCATNKCTSNVCHMTWCGPYLITVGTRHVKVWQLPDHEKGSPDKRSRLKSIVDSALHTVTPLAGRNCLLGDLANATFTCVVPVNEREVIICPDSGPLCLVDLGKSPAELIPIDNESSPTGAIGFLDNPRRLVWAEGGQVCETSLDALLEQKGLSAKRDESDPAYGQQSASRVPRKSTFRQSLGLGQLCQSGTIAVACLTKHIIYIDTDANLVLISSNRHEQCAGSRPLSSHNEPVEGIQALDAKSGLGSFFTWSRNGEVRFWDHDAQLLRVEQIELDDGSENQDAVSNELNVLRHCSNGLFVSGDRFGVLKLTRYKEWDLLHTARAHSAEVNDICVDHTLSFIATCSRDRMVQVFSLQDTVLQLLQTTDDHIAAVNQIVFSMDGNTLLSCSADRTIIVREKASRSDEGGTVVAFLQTRIITIKASPLSMCLVPGSDNLLYVSALDRHVTKVDFATGTILNTFKVADTDTDDHAVLNAIKVTTSNEAVSPRPLLVGCSSTDKSIRVYDLHKQILLSKESAHTEGVSDLALLEHDSAQEALGKRTFVSTGHDSTIMVWTIATHAQVVTTPAIELTQEEASLNYDSDMTPAKGTPAALPPLRKVLTKLDIAGFVRVNSPQSSTQLDPSPAPLQRKGSKLTLNSSAIEEGDENTSPALRRRASADDRAKIERRSPSPPPYATRRQKKPVNRGEMTKDFFARQSEWLGKSPEPQDTGPLKQESRANKSRLRRPPSVPTDLRTRASAQERQASTTTALADSALVHIAPEQMCRLLRAYREKLEVRSDGIGLAELEFELELLLRVIEKKKEIKAANATASVRRNTRPPGLQRSATSDTMSLVQGQQSSNSLTGGGRNSPPFSSILSRQSTETARQRDQMLSTWPTDIALDGLSVLLEKTNLAEA